ncbi:putative aldo/keto reductase-like oxidoreductase [Methanomicrobium sp. W14]|uniref:aldo/keto reductase n=1 Tax=Methanomicrobium sp. W14 TaxID=2817839 RepID=UPI001AE655B4|nr:aldo/keto reductase [Methanomicrobium sp. W14]MBP2134274.1 putative aldo/keto reductase-like oxidoreductase [Methanomicrobium sp. W14]
MQYRKVLKNGDELSALGFGAMRLPVTKGGQIDEKKATALVRYAIDNGINYIDTAYPYHGGESESFLGRALKEGYREKIKLATKLPAWEVRTYEDFDKYLNRQLEKLQTDHIDYYLLHSLNENTWKNVKNLGVLDFLNKAKNDGRIVNAGFSFHSDRKTFKEIVDSYGWEFCLIQYNFIDEENQAGTEGLRYATSKGLAVMVMEPLRGGTLAEKLPREIEKIYSESGDVKTPAQRALRWIWNHPEVTVVLSGMNTQIQVEENIKTAEQATPGSMTGAELKTMEKAAEVYRKLLKVPCTGCSYCMPCPFGVNIPMCFYFYNQYYMSGKKLITRGTYIGQMMGIMGEPSNASLCRNCGKCLKSCPQHIKIPEELKKTSKTLEGLRTKLMKPLVKRFLKAKDD